MVENSCNVCHRPASEHPDGLFCCAHCGSAFKFRNVFTAGGAERFGAACTECDIELWDLDSEEEVRRQVNRRASGWVACAERMPVAGAAVLFTSFDGTQFGYWDGGHWRAGGYKYVNAVHWWMPLPLRQK